MNSPTQAQYDLLQAALDFFNAHLFNNALPHCLITHQRRNKMYGYFWLGQFSNGAEQIDEIAINPEYLHEPPIVAIQTLVHEMTHAWQWHYGTPSRSGYHNHEWAAKMQSIGLIPSDTGKPGGKKTGQRMSDYVEQGGVFEQLYNQFATTYDLKLWAARPTAAKDKDKDKDKTRQKKRDSKTKYTCPTCGSNAWAKPLTLLICGRCNELMEAPVPTETSD